MKAFLSSMIANIRRSPLSAGVIGLAALLASGQAAALTCGPVYSSQIINGGTFSPRLYQLNGTTATLDSTASQNLDGIGQATDTNIYFDNGGNNRIRRFTGTTTTQFATNWISYGGGTPGSSGPGGGADGNIYYVGSNRHLYRVTTAGVITDLGLVSAAVAADATIWANMTAGDLAADTNGRLYWLGSSGANTYLFRIDRGTLQAYNLGTYGVSGATGLAFNAAGLLVSTTVTGNTTSVFTIDLSSPNTSGTVLGNATGFSANGAALDLGSCNLPTLNPTLATTKTVANITRAQTPAIFALPGDVLEYTVTIANSGNLPAEQVTLSDAIPANTTYVAGSTTLNGTAVADAPAGTMPYSPASTGTREVHSAGRPSGEILAGAGGAAVVRFRVTVAAAPLPATIDNQATASYFTVNGGVSTPQTAPSPVVQTPVPNPRVTLTKVTLGGFGGPFTFTGNNGWTSQNISTTSAGTGVAGATQTLAATGVSTTIAESALPVGYALTALTCSNLPAGGTATVNLATREVTFNAAAMVRGADIACTFTNTVVTTDLSITKTDGQTLYAPGQTNTYTIVVANAGPNAANGAIFTDPAVAGLTVSAVTCGGATGGAACPASSTVAAMQGSGIVIPTLPSGGSVTFTVTATVGAGVIGNLTNTANIATPVGVTDTNTANNSATDTDTLQPNFGSCDARMYLSQSATTTTNTTLQLINTSTNPLTFPVLGTGTAVYNALGFNPTDFYIYGIDAFNSSGNSLIRIGADGSTVNLGVISGLPLGSYTNGEVTPSGVFYIKATDGGTLYQINTSALTATAIPLSTAVSMSDFAWYGNALYGVNQAVVPRRLVSIDPSTGTVTDIGPIAAITTNTFGSMYGSPSGLFGNYNNGGFYQFDPATGAVTLISSSPSATVNDGAHCASANITFGADIAVTKTDGSTTYTPGTNVVYTITATNNGPFGAQNATVSDPLPAGITTASWTCTASGGGACAASGSGAINDTTVDLPVGAVATYTLTLTVPANYTGNLTNTATATVGPGNTDPTPGNDTATDTDTQNSQVDLSITKTDGRTLYAPGQTNTYTIVVSNAGPSAADGAIFTDPAVAGLTVSSVTCGGATGGAACPASSTVAAMQGSGIVIPTLPSGGSVTFTVTATAGAGVIGNLTNTANIAAPSGATDTNTANNSATDTDALQPNFGSCDARMYLSQGPNTTTNTTLYDINISGNPLTFPPIAQGSNVYNAIGFHPTDFYVYGINQFGNNGNSLIRIGADGSTIDLGTITGLPADNYLAGDVGGNGLLYVKSSSTVMYAINVATRVATPIALTPAVPGGQDLAWANGTLYLTSGATGQLYSINPATGATAPIGAPIGSGWNFGALYGSPNGLYGNDNNGTGFYQIDLSDGSITRISNSPGAQTNDGAHCVNANITFPADIAVTKTDGSTTYTPGTNVTYTITATNNGPFGAQNVTVSDPLPTGITTASWTCTASGGGACAASGSGAINDSTVDLPVGAVATYTMTLTVPANYTGNLTNTATATVGPGNTDPTPGNDTATDTDTQNSQADLVITKTNTPGVNGEVDQAADTVTSGTATTYSIVVTNNGPSSADGAVVTDPAPTGLSCATATCSAGGGATCPAQTGAALVTALQGAGAAIPVLPVGGNVTFTLSCQVL